MTATHERQSAPSRPGAPEWAERSLFGTNRGVPLWGAVLLAALATALGAALDLLIWGRPGLLTQACYFVACVLAVVLVQRRNLFGPMVQTPLVVSIIVPLITLLGGEGGGDSGAGKAIAIVQPLIANFPMMAITTGVVLVLGLVRMFVLQRADSEQDADEVATKKARPRTAAVGSAGAGKRSSGQPARGEQAARANQSARRGHPGSRGQAAPKDQAAPRGQAPQAGQQAPAKQQGPPKGGKSGRSDRNRGQAPADGRGSREQAGRSRGQAPERNRGAPRQEPPRGSQERGGQNRGGQGRGGQGQGNQRRDGQGRGGQARGGQDGDRQGRGREGRPERGNSPGRGAPRRESEGGQGRPNRGNASNQNRGNQNRENQNRGNQARGRPAPGRGRPQDPNRGGEQPPQRRPRKPRRDDFP